MKLALLGLLLVAAATASATTSRVLAPQDEWPAWSPDGAHFAFTRVYSNHMELLTFDTHSRRVARIGSNAGQLGPSWSSDGTRLAYNSGGLLWIANADGTAKRRYTAPAPALAPAWQPGTTAVAYLTTHGAQNTDLWVAGKLWAANVIGHPA